MITANTRVVGVSPGDISREAFTSMLRAAKSPAAVEADAIFDVLLKERVSITFILALFQHESNFGLMGINRTYKTLNPGNCRTSTIGPQELIQTERGVFVRYNSWTAGFHDLANRLSTPAYVYAQEGRTTIEQVITRFAPSGDFDNKPADYIAAVVQFMATHQQQKATQEVTNNTMALSNIEWRAPGSPNFFPDRQGLGQPVAIVDHIMSGTMESSDNWFKNPASQVSAHYGVARDGRIWQWVRLTDGSWANGIVQNPDMSVPFIADCVSKGINPNDVSISIEHEGMTGDPMPEAQYQATLWLHRYIIKLYPAIKPDREHLVGHYQLTARDRANCPGTGFPWSRLIKDLNASDSTAPAAPSLFNPNPKGLDIGAGMWAKLMERQLTAATNEQYYQPADGQAKGLGKRSFLWTNEGPMLIAMQDVSPQGDPLQSWEVRVLQEV